ncbi:MAG: hypothetical protein QMD21_05760 [Candidatus Thermoplasmatota archaeon]|nr:hypothetical protein [Candidatus Thermoplasmatota archaeon]
MIPDNEDIIRRLKTCRGEEIKWYGELEKGFVEELKRLSGGFVDPATGKLVTAAEFVSWLDLERYPEIFSLYDSFYEGREMA